MAEAAAAAGVSETGAKRWMTDSGGMIPDLAEPSGRYLSLAEREDIAIWWEQDVSRAEIARRLGRHRSTIGRELKRNKTVRYPSRPPAPDGPRRPGPAPGTHRGQDRPQHERVRYRAWHAQAKAEARARRPKPHARRLACRPWLRTQVQARLDQHHSPEQIAGRLRRDHPDSPECWVSHETIYQELYRPRPDGLDPLLTRKLRTRRRLRKPRRLLGERRGKRVIAEANKISARPVEAAERTVPGHWEGDLIIGKDGASAIATLVERTTRYTLLLALPDGHHSAAVRDALLAVIPTLPNWLWRSLTWDQGNELARHAEITAAGGPPIYFCDPHSPWQRPSNENTNGLVRQYLPKGTDLSVHTPEELAAIAAELNNRPRKTLGWLSPAEALHELLSQRDQLMSRVATTP